MRHLFFVLSFIIFLTQGHSQNSDNHIVVSASASYIDTNPTYKATVILGSGYSSLPDELMDLEKLKSQFKEQLKKLEIPYSELKEKPYEFGYEIIGHEKEGIVYEYETKSVSKMTSFLKVSSLGLQHYGSYVIIRLDDKAMEEISKKALANATKKAQHYANALGKNLGSITKIEDIQFIKGNTVEQSLFYDRQANLYLHSVNVTFKIEE